MTQKTNIPAYWNELKDLWNEFDPIGVFQMDIDWPMDDEYYSYILPTYPLLAQNADFNEIYTYMERIVKKHMGMETLSNQHITNFVHKLQNWYRQTKT